MEKFLLTVQQKNIWNLQKYYEDTAISNLCGVVFFKEKRNSSFLQQAIRRFIQSQSGMRMRFSEEGEPRQYVVNEINDEIPVMSFPSMEEFDAYAEKMAKKPLGLADRAMYRFSVFTVDGKSGILAVLSHLISDAWTFSLMVNQVDAAYREIAWGG